MTKRGRVQGTKNESCILVRFKSLLNSMENPKRFISRHAMSKKKKSFFQSPAFIRGNNPKSKIQNPKSNDRYYPN
ncbi:MAG TPA: hypothetical protein DCY91_05780 [Cyanobacteria bacterium UBA11370]|nr:hypothetical protein [Cyanobacteria bacterium UBA11370]HBY79617.1 hypothetical protein [Cyanobacteria bacterium UBA11148]